MKGISTSIVAVYAALANAGSQGAPTVEIISKNVSVDIAPQSIAEALNEWAQQTGLQLIFPDDETSRQTQSTGVRGILSPESALKKLILGTGLTYTFVNSRTVAVHNSQTQYTKSPLSLSSLEPAPLQAIRVGVRREHVIVTGSRLPSDVRADESRGALAYLMTFDRPKLDQLGISTVGEMLRYLPQQPYGPRVPFSVPNSAQFAEPRGLGPDTTLILINGRRATTSADSIGSNGFDLNGIPLAAVERIEVLPDSASAVYGADAVGGVINIILKHAIPQPVIDVQYGAAAGGADERRISLSGGYTNSRLSSSLVLDYFARGQLLGEERDRWRNQDFRRFGGVDGRDVTTNPGNVSSLTGENLPGLPATFAAVPRTGSIARLSPADFLATAGQRNSESLLKYASILPEVENRSLTGSIDFELTPTVSAFGEILFSRRRNVQQYLPSQASLLVPASNLYNPFGVPVRVDYLFSDIGPRQSILASEWYRASAGLRGAWRDWEWEISGVHIDDRAESGTHNAVDMNRVAAALSATTPADALNVFSDVPGGSPTLLTSLVADPLVNRDASIGTQVAGVLRGTLFDLPAGHVQGVVGAEWLTARSVYDEYATRIHVRIANGRTVTAAFAEMRLPIVDASMGIPAVSKLFVTLAARDDHYSDFGDTFNPQYGIVWKPWSDLTLRTSFGTSFRAPSLFDLGFPRTTVPALRVPDPLRNNQPATVTFITGGNPELAPSRARSLTTGFLWSPAALDAFQISASYWRIKLDNRVRVIPYNVLAMNVALFPGRVIRAEQTDADRAAGLPGVLESVDITRINYGSVETSGVDVGVRYSLDTPVGLFTSTASATWVAKYTSIDIPGTLATDRRGVAIQLGSVAPVRAVATVEWNHAGAALSATARFTSGYRDLNIYTNLSKRSVASQTLLDVQGSLKFDEIFGHEAWSTGVQVTAGVSNIFDKEPPYAEVGDIQGYDTTQGELRQRFAYLRLAKRF